MPLLNVLMHLLHFYALEFFVEVTSCNFVFFADKTSMTNVNNFFLKENTATLRRELNNKLPEL